MTMDKINKYLIFLFFLIVPLSHWKAKFHGIPVSVDFVIASLAIIVFLIRHIRDKNLGSTIKNAVVMDNFGKLIIVYLFVSILSFSKSVSISASINELLRFLSYILLYYIIIFDIREREDVKNIMLMLIAACILVSVFGLIQYFTGFGLSKDYIVEYGSVESRRIPSTMYNPNNFAAYLMLTSFPILLFGLYTKDRKYRISLIALFCLMAVNLLLTFSRGAWVGFALSAAVLAIVYNPRVLYIIAGVSVPSLFINSIRERFLSIFTLTSDSNVTRLRLWQTGLKMAHENPILGVGLGNSIYRYDEYIKRFPQLDTVYHYTMYPLHNSYIKVLAETGVIGLAAFLLIIGYMVIKTYKIYKASTDPMCRGLALGYFITLPGYLFMNIVDNCLFDPQTAVFFWLIFGLIVASGRIENTDKDGRYGKV